MGRAIFKAVSAVVEWLLRFIEGLAGTILDGFLAGASTFLQACGVDEGPILALDGLVQEWFSVLNQWVPVDAAICAITGYVSFVTAFVALKFLAKLTPWVG